MNRERRGRHEAVLGPLERDHDAVRSRARTSLVSHLGYEPRHRKATR